MTTSLLILAALGAQTGADGLTPPELTTRTRTAIMSITASGVPEEYAEGLTETIATTVQETGVFETISPRQLSSLLAYEKRKELLGGCVQEACYVQIAKTVKAEHLVAGSVARVGDKLTLNLVLIDAAQGKALKRTNRESAGASNLLEEARQAVIVLLQPILSARRGYLKVAVNVPDAALVVDDAQRIEGVGQVIALAAGPHVLKVERDGFYATTADVFVRPGRVSEEDVKLIPARETIEQYESSASLMRWGAYGTAVVAVGAAVASGIFYGSASDDKSLVDSYSRALAIDRAAIGTPNEIQAASDSFQTNQALYLTFLGTAVVSGGVSLFLWLTGDDPDRYDEFHTLSGM